MVGDRLARMREEHRVAIEPPTLQHPDLEVLLYDCVRRLCSPHLRSRRKRTPGVVCVDLLAQQRAFQRARRFALLFRGQARREDGVVKELRARSAESQSRLSKVLVLEMTRDAWPTAPDAGVEPGLCVDRRDVRFRTEVRGRNSAPVELRELLRVPLFHHAETPELALDAVVVAMVVGEPGHETGATDVVERLHALDDMHGE